MSFRDHFSTAAASYAEFRPRYPAALFAHLAGLAPARDAAWDCATGSGQAALGLAEHFARVIATDASAAQVAAATAHPRIEYRVAPAERSGLAAASVQLVSVAQALHWLDQQAFHAEVRRVVAPGGVAAAWGYALFELDPAVNALVRRFAHETLAGWWPPERRHVDDEYRSLPWPHAELPFPALAIEQPLTLHGLAGYLGTWSSVLRHREALGRDPVEPLVRDLAGWWGDAAAPRPVRWPLFGRIGIVAG